MNDGMKERWMDGRKRKNMLIFLLSVDFEKWTFVFFSGSHLI
jgi:hypothetical protein